MGSRAGAILWAQWRTLRNLLPRSSKAGILFSILIGAVWYGSFTALAIASGFLLADPEELAVIARILPGALLLAFLYWQLIPLLLVSTGSALDLKKLIAYPISPRELFGIETLLRLSTGIEVILVLIGAMTGLLLNRRIPLWAPLSLIAFAVFNLFMSVGIRDLLARLFARKGIRELMVFLFVIVVALPQVLVVSGSSKNWKNLSVLTTSLAFPWTAAAAFAQGHNPLLAGLSLLGWTLAGYLFGRWQFDQGLRFDAQEASAPASARPGVAAFLERFYRAPGAFFADPLGGLIEKELRFLSRSARFRLVFLMGFSFGLLIWLPVTFSRNGPADSWMARNYLTVVSSYSLLLLSDVLFWNCLGFDRAAAQMYFLIPVSIRTMLRAKNISAMIYIFLEITAVALVCGLLRFPLSPARLLEAYAVTITIALFLMSVGNLSSMFNPRAVDPSKSFRSSAGRQTQTVLMLFFPLALLPVSLAYAARYAFQSYWAFSGVLLFMAAFGLVAYHIAMNSAVAAAERRKEQILATLSGSEGPISG